MVKPRRKKRRRVRFSIRTEPESEVFIAGTFNDWSCDRNRLKFKNGEYVTHLLIEPGRHEYKFVVNGEWCADPMCESWTPNEFGSLNSVIVV